MVKYIGFRIFQALLGLWFIATLVFILSRSIGDPAEVFTARNSGVDAREIMAAKLGLDRPVHEQYLKFLGQLVRLDLGDSVSNGIPVTQILVERMPATFTLGLVALIFALAFSLPLGVLGAVYRDSAIDWIAKVLAFLGQSMPPFWSGIMLIILFAVVWEMLPPAGKGGWTSYILPGFTLGWGVMAGMVRLVRSSMMDVLDSDYVAMGPGQGPSRSRGDWQARLAKRPAARPHLQQPGAGRLHERLGGGGTGFRLARHRHLGSAERGTARLPGNPGGGHSFRQLLHPHQSVCGYYVRGD